LTIALTSTSTSSRILPSDPKQVHPISYCLFENVPETREQRSWVETSRSRAIPRGTERAVPMSAAALTVAPTMGRLFVIEPRNGRLLITLLPFEPSSGRVISHTAAARADKRKVVGDTVAARAGERNIVGYTVGASRIHRKTIAATHTKETSKT